MRTITPVQWVIAAVAGAALLALAAFAVTRVLAGEDVLGDVTALGAELGGLSPDEARQAMEEAAGRLTDRPVPFRIRDSVVELVPSQVGLEFDVSTMTDEALAVGRRGNLSEQFLWWLGHFGSTEEIIPVAELDDEAVEEVLTLWDQSYVGNPPVAGGVAFEGEEPVPQYPRAGEEIDRSVAPAMIRDAVVALDPVTVDLPVVTAVSDVSDADVDQAVARSRLLLAAPVTLRTEDGEVTIRFAVADMAAALRSEPGDGSIDLFFDPDSVGTVLERHRGDLERPPVDARFEVEGTEVRIIPGRPGTLVDPVATAEALEAAAGSSTRTGTLPFEEGAQPEVGTAELEGLGVEHLVSRFTTYHECCENRVVNIQKFADTVDRTIVRPGEQLGLNELVGPRTPEEGYLEAGSIIAGELTDSVGGGVSQFATTFYNAVYWGGYEDVTHKPHSFYFDRYPEGIEATISWPQPELAFRNDSDAAVLIVTSYTDTSITVAFYGANDGRIVVGEHPIGGPTLVEVVAEGGSGARRVSSEVSDRFDPTEPRTIYRPDPDLDVDEERRVQTPGPGWSVTVTRTLTVGDESSSREWLVIYRPREEILEVHPCRMPEAEEECPEPTTTTTTTTTPETTTTVAEPDETAPPEQETGSDQLEGAARDRSPVGATQSG